MPENRKPQHRLDPRSPLVLDTRELGRRAGSMRTVRLPAPAPADLGVELIGVPAGSEIDLDLRLESVMEGVLVSGTAAVQLAGECGRCLEPVVETLTVVITAVRIWLAFAMIGKTATPAQAVAQTSAVIIAAAVGIFPSGLGLRELLAGAVGAVVGLDAAAAVAATAADRVAAQIGLAVLAGGLLFFTRHEGKTVEDEIEEAIEAVDEDPYLHPMDLP